MKTQTTILLIESARIVRADLSPPGSKDAPRVYEQPRLGGAGLLEAVSNGLALAPRCGRFVWVAADDIWMQTLTLPSGALVGLKESELSGALAFEAEPLSGIPSSGAAVGFAAARPQRTDGLNDYATIAMDAMMRDDIQATVKKAGGKLSGICCLRSLPAVKDFPKTDEWVAACAEQFVLPRPEFPAIAPAPEKISPLRYYVLALALEAAVIAGCFAHWTWTSNTLKDTQARVESMRVPRKKYEEMKAKNETVKTELQKLNEENARNAALIKGAEDELAYQRIRITTLLQGLANDKPRDIVLLSIQSKDAALFSIEGLSLRPDMADAFATQLGAALSPAGLRVEPIEKSAVIVARDGGPWKFTFHIIADAVHALPDAATTALTARRYKGKAR
jgi:hypothetical protein